MALVAGIINKLLLYEFCTCETIMYKFFLYFVKMTTYPFEPAQLPSLSLDLLTILTQIIPTLTIIIPTLTLILTIIVVIITLLQILIIQAYLTINLLLLEES